MDSHKALKTCSYLEGYLGSPRRFTFPDVVVVDGLFFGRGLRGDVAIFCGAHRLYVSKIIYI